MKETQPTPPPAPDRRSLQRRQLDRPAIVYGAGDHVGWVINVSSSGLLVELPSLHDPYAVGQSITLDISMAVEGFDATWLRANGKVVRLHRSTAPRQYGVAITKWDRGPDTRPNWNTTS